MRSLALLLPLLATSVAGQQHPDVDGACAKYLSHQGVLEITAIAYDHPDIRKPVYHIIVTDRDRAKVYSGRRPRIGDIVTEFGVRRKGGHWRLVAGSVNDSDGFGLIPILFLPPIIDMACSHRDLTNRCNQPLAGVRFTLW
jgi:hypothetical protein